MMKSHVIKYIFLLFGAFDAASILAQAPVVRNGVLDLRDQELSSKPFSLSGDWLFFWNKLVQPGDTIKTGSSFVHYPSLWKDDILKGKTLPSQGYASYLLTVLLPKQRSLLALEIPDVYSSYALYVNNKLLVQCGKTGTTADQSKPFWVTRVVRLPENADTISIVLQVANFWHAKGGVHKDMIIGNQEYIANKHKKEIAYGFCWRAVYLWGGLFFCLYLLGDRIVLFSSSRFFA